ncbi:MAG: NAD(P)-binding protein [Chloroflexi bacterium]|nr:NAD(P)-binding protein [Chloroflexota bacterium]
MNNEFEIVIIGAGPAGSSAALRIAQRDPDLARKILVLEKANFPRAKLCAGGVTTHADNLLARLGARVDVPRMARIVSREKK